jgi:hypothetical protein
MTQIRDPNAELSFKLRIRVYGRDENRTESHSYLLDDFPTGITWVVGELNINIRTKTLAQVRPMIEYSKENNIVKRTILFQEVLFIMGKLPNYYNREKPELVQYRFGFVKKDKTGFRLLSVEDEEKPIADLIGAVDFFGYDLCIVPLSQIPK